MKYIGNFFKGLIFSVWLVIAIFTTVCLISFNDYRISEFGKTSVIIVDDENWEPNFKENEILFVKKEKQLNYKEGDIVFFYKKKSADSYLFYGQIDEAIHSNGSESYYRFGEGDSAIKIPYRDIIGGANKVYKLPSTLGIILSIFESRWGYMFLVIFPTLFLLVYEIYNIVIEFRKEYAKENKSTDKTTEEE